MFRLRILLVPVQTPPNPPTDFCEPGAWAVIFDQNRSASYLLSTHRQYSSNFQFLQTLEVIGVPMVPYYVSGYQLAIGMA